MDPQKNRKRARRGGAAGRRLAAVFVAATAVAACGRAVEPPAPTPRAPVHTIVPAPASVRISPADSFAVDSLTVIVPTGGAEATRIAEQLAALLGTWQEWTPRVLGADDAVPALNTIELALDASRSALGAEGYALTVHPERVRIVAAKAAGLFYGVRTLRQLLPPVVEYTAHLPQVLRIPAAEVVDRPRFEWRGMMLDVTRHFLEPEDVKRFIDLLAMYKMNRLHLHLSDEQGWRIEIPSWPELTARSGGTAVGGAPGGYYTREEFRDIVAYARERFITIVPEIDMPGHTNAALAAYPELNCDDVARPAYTGIRVGFSALCVERDTTYAFIDDVVREITELNPTGEYFHIGGDEVERLTDEQYRSFVERVEQIVTSYGKRMVGWGDIAPARLRPTTIVQHWRPDSAAVHAARGGKVILSPSSRVYVDMKYDSTTAIGLNWAGFVTVRHAYDWEPATYLPGVPESAILGVEAPLWAETLGTRFDYEYMAFPRVIGVAELGWSPADATEWEDYRLRLRAQEPRLQALGVNFYRSPELR